jgi:hypothetical protein
MFLKITEIAQIFGQLFFPSKIYAFILTKYILDDIFTNSSGHPGATEKKVFEADVFESNLTVNA